MKVIGFSVIIMAPIILPAEPRCEHCNTPNPSPAVSEYGTVYWQCCGVVIPDDHGPRFAALRVVWKDGRSMTSHPYHYDIAMRFYERFISDPTVASVEVIA